MNARVPECLNIKKGGLDQYGAERLAIDSFWHNLKKNCETERVDCRTQRPRTE